MSIWSLIESIPCPEIGFASFIILFFGSFIFGTFLLLQPSYREPRVRKDKKIALYKGRYGGRR